MASEKERAARLARVLVEELVEEERSRLEICAREGTSSRTALSEEIGRVRETYAKRVSEELRTKTSYLEDALRELLSPYEPAGSAPEPQAREPVQLTETIDVLGPQVFPSVPTPALDAYEILQELGAGAAGVTHKGRHKKLARPVAIKFLRKLSPTSQRRFLREAQALASLDHPRIVGIYDYGQVEDQLYMVLEFVEGGSVRDLLRTSAFLPIEQCVRIVRGILNGLACAHSSGILHRDIKPANLLLDQRGEVKIADFGVAKLVGIGGETRDGTTVGTPFYMAPELFVNSSRVEVASDLYSVGVLLFELLTGQRPFGRPGTLASLVVAKHNAKGDPQELRKDVPDWLASYTRKMMAPEPQDRFQSADEALEALDARQQPSIQRPSATRKTVLRPVIQLPGERPAIVRPPPPPKRELPLEELDPPTVPSAATLRGVRMVLRSADQDYPISLRPEVPFTLGRSSQRADLRISDDELSREHCELRYVEGSGVWLEDKGSLNGTSLNGRRLTARTQIFHGDMIQLGDTVLTVHCPQLTADANVGLSCARCGKSITSRDVAEGRARVADGGVSLVCIDCLG